MKKIRLNVADLGATEILSREQLRSVFGGGSGSGSSADECDHGQGACGYAEGKVCTTSTGARGRCTGTRTYCVCD